MDETGLKSVLSQFNRCVWHTTNSVPGLTYTLTGSLYTNAEKHNYEVTSTHSTSSILSLMLALVKENQA